MSVAGRRARRIVLRVVAVVAAVVIIAGAALGIHYARHASDAKMLQGEWLVQGTDMTIVFNDDTIRFPGSVDYKYTIDPFRGRIEFTHGERTGSASYRIDPGGNRVTLSESITTMTESTSQGRDGSTVVTTQEERMNETTVLLRVSYDPTARAQLTGGIARWEQSGLGGTPEGDGETADEAAPETGEGLPEDAQTPEGAPAEGAPPEGEGVATDGADQGGGPEAGTGGSWDNISERGADGDAGAPEDGYDSEYSEDSEYE